jgi:Flp pilus assembly protein TadB
MFESLVRILFDGASALAAGLIVYVILSGVAGFGQWIYQRRRPRWLQQLERQQKPLQSGNTQQGNLGRTVILSFAVGLGLKAALTGGILVAVFLICLGLALYFYLGQRAGSMAREQVTDAVSELVAAYYSAYLVIPTVFGALSEAIKTQTNSFLQGAVQRALDAFGAGKTSEEVLEQLDREVQNPYLSQFAFILRHTSESNQKEILNTLRDLSNRLDQRKRLKDRSRVALALVSGTVRFLQAANGAVMALAVLAPFWWDFYASSVSRQALLMIGGTIAILGSWYFENQLTQLRERVL